MFNDVDKPWEGFAGRETGKSRNRSVANARDNISSPTREDRYKGLTPPISPAQVSDSGRGRGVTGGYAHVMHGHGRMTIDRGVTR